MPIVNFPFIRSRPDQPFRPMVHVRIVNPQTGLSILTMALIDTGADDCALPATFASLIGYKLTDGIPKCLATANGEITAYAHSCTIEILNKVASPSGQRKVVYTIRDTPVDFIVNLEMPLLGAVKFLSRFILTVNYPEKVFSIRKP